MTEDEIKAIQDQLATEKSAREEAERKASEAEASRNNVVEELKGERQKKAEALEKLEEATKRGTYENEKPEDTVRRIIAERETEDIKSNFNYAVDEVKKLYREF